MTILPPLPPVRVRLIGYWVDEARPDLPDPADLVDQTLAVSERQAISDYLNAGRPVRSGTGCSVCRLCGEPNGFEEFTDGTFQWPEGLAHYVLDHGVRLPKEITRHIANSDATVGLVDGSWWVSATA